MKMDALKENANSSHCPHGQYPCTMDLLGESAPSPNSAGASNGPRVVVTALASPCVIHVHAYSRPHNPSPPQLRNQQAGHTKT